MKFLVAAIVIALTFTACSDSYNVRPFNSSISPPKHIVYKNYTIGAVQTAYVGAPVVRVKDYYVTRSYFKSYTSQRALSVTMDNTPTIHYPASTQFLVISTISYNNTKYFVVIPKHPLPDNTRLLVTKNGQYNGLVLTRDSDDGEVNIFKACGDEDDICIKPIATTLTPARIEKLGDKPLKTHDFISYEIIYSGATKNTINLLYREYTSDDMARPAYTQNLTYDRTSPTLRFRNVEIRVVDASNQDLKYTVVADGLAQTSAEAK